MKTYINKIIITVGVIALVLIPVKVNADVNYSYYQLPYTITSNPINNPPVVNAGSDLSLPIAFPTSSTNISTTGSATDSDGVVASMAWSVLSAPAGASVNISPSSSTPNLTPASLFSNFSNLSVAGVYTFCLDAIDDDAASATPDCMNVTVTGAIIVEDIDLIASVSSPTTATVGIATSFSSVITNQGMDPTGAPFSNFFQVAASTNGGGPIADLASTSMGALAGNGATDITTSPNYTFFTVGTFSVRACADKFNSGSVPPVTIDETNENNNCGPWTDVVVSPPILPAPTISFGAVTNPISSGQTARLVWTTQNATSCETLSGPWLSYGPRPAAQGLPGESTGVLTIQTNFGIKCTGPNGFATAYTTVYIIDDEDPLPPTISYFQPFSCVSSGSGFGAYPRFTWNSAHTTSCTLSRTTAPTLNEAVGISSQASGGSLESDGLYYYLSNMAVIGSSSNYSLQCFNGTQNVIQYAAVNTCSPDFSMSASPILRSFVNGTNPGTGNPGKIATYTISVNPISGFNSPVALSVSSYPTMPASTSFTFSQNTVIRNGSSYETSVLTIGIDLADFPPAGSGPVYTPIVVQGDGGGFTRTVTIGADSSGKTRPIYIER